MGNSKTQKFQPQSNKDIANFPPFELTPEILMNYVFWCYNCQAARKVKAQWTGLFTIRQIQVYCLTCKKDITYIVKEELL